MTVPCIMYAFPPGFTTRLGRDARTLVKEAELIHCPWGNTLRDEADEQSRCGFFLWCWLESLGLAEVVFGHY